MTQKILHYVYAAIMAVLSMWVMYTQHGKTQAITVARAAQAQVAQLQQANAILTATVADLENSARTTAAFMLELDQRRQSSERKAATAQQHYRKAKDENPTIRSWADTRLPDGLY